MIRPQREQQKNKNYSPNQQLLKSFYKIGTSSTQKSPDNKSVGNVGQRDASFKKKLYHGSAPKV